MHWPPLTTASTTLEERHTQLTQNIGSISTNQSSIITTCTSVESEVKDSSKHMVNVYSELQKIARQNEAQASLSVGNMAKGALEEMIQRTMLQVLEDSNLSERVQSLTPEEIQPQEEQSPVMTKDAKEYSGHHAKAARQYAVNEESVADDPPKRTRKTTVESREGVYKSWLGTMTWRSRVIRTTHLDYEIENDRLQTYLCWQPASWILRRSISLTIMRATSGWTYRFNPYRLVPEESLIFKYCRSGNIAGIQDLFSHGIASPLDINFLSLTHLHVRALSSQRSTNIDGL